MFCGKSTFIGSPLHIILVLMVLVMFLIVMVWMNKLSLADFWGVMTAKGL